MTRTLTIERTDTPGRETEADVLLVPCFSGGDAPEGLEDAWSFAGEERFRASRGTTSFQRAGECAKARWVGFVGLGSREAWSPAGLRGDLTAGLAAARQLGVPSVAFDLSPVVDDENGALVAHFAAEGALYGTYRFDAYKKRGKNEPSDIETVVLCGLGSDLDEAISAGRAVAEGTCLARDWVGEPPNICTPYFLAERAREIAEKWGLELVLFEGLEAIENEKMGLMAGVAKGSVNPPAFIHLTYRSPGLKDDAEGVRKLAFVGKGVTFDSGGYSIKPTSGQIGMQADMAGGAAVLAAAHSVAALAPANAIIHFIIPSAENMVSSKAYRVNDVLTGRGGTTVEITNTDAEGRLLLADGLVYAQELGVDAIVDIATLTGGCVVTFAGIHAAVLANNSDAAERFLALGAECGEAYWELPLAKRLRKTLDSPVADIKNSGGRWGSTTQGALFLAEFVGETPWVHIDMAGLEIYDAAWEHMPKGPTGFGVATLAHLACHY